MKTPNIGAGAVAGVLLATLWLAIVAGLQIEQLEDGSGTLAWFRRPMTSYCLPWRECAP